MTASHDRPVPATCTCGAAIYWTVTESDKRLAVEATPMLEGTLRLFWRAGVLRSAVLLPMDIEDHCYTSHVCDGEKR